MPLPLLIPLAIGGGWLAKKGAEAYADHIRSKAHEEEQFYLRKLELLEAEYTQTRFQYLNRLLSYSQVIKAILGDGPVELRKIPRELPLPLQEIWREISNGDGFLTPSREIGLGLNPGEERKMFQGAGYVARHNPNLAPAIAVAVSAHQILSGASQILDANKRLSYVKTQSAAAIEKADIILKDLSRAYEELSISWDTIIFPHISAAAQEPKNPQVIFEYRSFAAKAEQKAIELLKEYENGE